MKPGILTPPHVSDSFPLPVNSVLEPSWQWMNHQLAINCIWDGGDEEGVPMQCMAQLCQGLGSGGQLTISALELKPSEIEVLQFIRKGLNIVVTICTIVI